MSELQKLYQPISPKFDPNQKEWDKNEKIINNLYKNEIIQQKSEDRGKKLLHEKNISEIIYNTRIVFFNVLEMILKNENPLPFILSKEDNQLSICIIVILIGIILLLVSNILS